MAQHEACEALLLILDDRRHTRWAQEDLRDKVESVRNPQTCPQPKQGRDEG